MRRGLVFFKGTGLEVAAREVIGRAVRVRSMGFGDELLWCFLRAALGMLDPTEASRKPPVRT